MNFLSLTAHAWLTLEGLKVFLRRLKNSRHCRYNALAKVASGNTRATYTIKTILCVVLVIVSSSAGLYYSWVHYLEVGVSRNKLLSSEEADELPTLDELSNQFSEELNSYDIALLNLRCAEGLPGAEELDITGILAELEQWSKRVRTETERNISMFYNKPHQFNNSEAYFRMLMLVTVLQQDFGVHYNLRRVDKVDFTKSQDLFLHGLVGSENGGTCVSIPVLYTSVAKRLGYPVFLVLAKEHLFCRWDGRGERVNIEGSNVGMSSYDDQHYMSWPHPINIDEVASGTYLRSLSNAESFSVFLAARGHCFEDCENRQDAISSYSLAIKYDPMRPIYQHFHARITRPKRLEDFPDLVTQQKLLYKRNYDQFHQQSEPFQLRISNSAADFHRQFQINFYLTPLPRY